MNSVYEIVLLPIVIWIISGNGMTIYAIIRLMPSKTCNMSLRRKRCTFMFLMSTALADFVIGAFIAPLGLYQATNNEWPSVVPCSIWKALDVTCCTASCYSIMMISLDRWLACVKLISPRWYTDRLVAFIIAGNNHGKYTFRPHFHNLIKYI